MSHTHAIELSTLNREEIPVAAAVAARGMRDNPSTVSLFGHDPSQRRQGAEPMYRWVLSSLQRLCLVARRDGAIVGIAALAPPDQCFFQQTRARQRTLSVGRMRMSVAVPQVPWGLLLPLLRLGPGALGRLSTLGDAGVKHDPQERHQHVELVVVDAPFQGQGIGRLMMEELCREIDTLPHMAYLETDKPENVRFYEHYGFTVIDEVTVLGTNLWYMERRAG